MIPLPKYESPQFLRVRFPDRDTSDGTVIDMAWIDGRWIYKMTFLDPDAKQPGEVYDNWIPEDWLEVL